MKSWDLYYRPKLTFWLGVDLRRRRQIRDRYVCMYITYILLIHYLYQVAEEQRRLQSELLGLPPSGYEALD